MPADSLSMESASKLDALSEKERETLRLIVRGHDAKSSARELGLSVHTINERLRSARRKLDVTSSKEAARILLQREGTPEKLADKQFGGAAAEEGVSEHIGKRARTIPAPFLIGAIVMTLVLAALAMAALPQHTVNPETATLEVEETEAETAARRFVDLIEAGEWQASYDATTQSFRTSNTLEVWTTASMKTRERFGGALSRSLKGVTYPPTPQGYRIVTFDTRFASRAEPAVETISMIREDGEWKVAGIFVE